ncbi:MAG TPA: hypothetical protein VH601_22755 [Bryobacteraceae bacterium]|jgi:anti-sigma factor RsiW
MKEHIREEQIALYAAGDLAAHEAIAVSAHIQDCELCRAALAGFQETQSFVFSSLIDPSADELSEVREGIRMKLRQHRGWIWWAAAAAAAVALIFTAVENKPTTVPKPAPPVARLVPPEFPHLEAPRVRTAISHRAPPRHRDAGIRSVDLIARADQPVMIKMTTPDPNVVILWQSNEKVNNE